MSKFNPQKISDYIKSVLIIMLIVVELIVCAQAYGDLKPAPYIVLFACCIVIAVIEAVNEFNVKSFVAKMVLYAFCAVLLFVICVLTGNTFLSTLYCIVLTGCYMSVPRFRDKSVIFGVGCGLYAVSYVTGRIIGTPTGSVYQDVISSLAGLFFGLVVLAVDFVVVQFVIKFYRTNKELSAALKEATESKAQLEEAYEQLTRTKVYEERNRIAKDIHDNVGHSITTVIMQTEAAKLLIDESPAEAKNSIISANIQARNALEQMRESIHLLAGRENPRSLKEELTDIIMQTIEGTDIRVRYDLADIQSNANLTRLITNAVKELLANGIRHGAATAFYIELSEEDGRLNLLVSDNGKGSDGVKEGFGLKSIREKTEHFSGVCSFSSEPGEGFETKITIPLKDEKGE